MKCTIERGEFFRALERVRAIVEARNTIPILSNVMLDVQGESLRVTATDLDMMATCEVPLASVAEAGTLTAPAAMLFDIARKLPDGAQVKLEFDKEDPRLAVNCGRSRFKIPVLPAGDFPTMDAGVNTGPVTLPSAVLARLIDKAGFAMSTEETRYYLNGLYLHVVVVEGVSMLRAVATDGHRLALAEVECSADLAGMFEKSGGVIMPRKTVKEFRRMLDTSVEVGLLTTAQKVALYTDSASLVSKVIDGAFPDYMRVIPRDNQLSASVDVGLLTAAVDRVGTVSAERSRSLRCEFEPGRVSLTVRGVQGDQGVEEVEVEYDGEAFVVGFNARYVLDLLARVGGDEVEFRFADPASPCLALDKSDPCVKFVLMPLRV